MDQSIYRPEPPLGYYMGFNPEFLTRAWEKRRAREAAEAPPPPPVVEVEQPVHKPSAAEIDRERAMRIMRKRCLPPWVINIVMTVASRHDMNPCHIIGPSRRRKDVAARANAIYAIMAGGSKRAVKPSAPRIAEWFDKDHTSILYLAARHAHATGRPNVTSFNFARTAGRKRGAKAQ